MMKTRWISLALMVLSAGISISVGLALGRSMNRGPVIDFQMVYCATRGLIEHRDPYSLTELREVFQEEGRGHSSGYIDRPQSVAWFPYLPTTFPLIAPFAILPWGSASVLWIVFLAGSLLLAALLMWSTAKDHAPGISLVLICILLANSEILIGGGNPAGIVVSLCVVAVWCFLRERFVPVGIVCMVVSLGIKPHDAGLVWLYFLLAGGNYRKRALQALAISAVLALAAILWVSQVSPHWIHEWGYNLSANAAHGAANDPGSIGSAGLLVDLQAVVAVFRDDPRIYNPISYLICGALLIVWSIATLRLPFSQARAWFAMAAVVPLTMLVTYHRPYDAKLLLLTLPACAMLWSEGGRTAWIALVATAAGIILTSDFPLAILQALANSMHVQTAGFVGETLTLALRRPAPIILLVMSIFYLWIYLRRRPAAT